MLLAVFRRLTGVVGLVALLALTGSSAACNRASGNEPDRVGADSVVERLVACELIGEADAARALGGDVRAPVATDDEGADALAGRSGCAWTTHDGRSAALFELVRTDDMSGSVRRTGFSARARYDGARSRHHDAPEIPALGDRAFWVDEAATLYVLSGGSYLVVEVATPRHADAQGIAVALATPAVQRLALEARQTGAGDE